jgi:hypothetical protein
MVRTGGDLVNAGGVRPAYQPVANGASTRRRKSFAGYDQRRKTKDEITIGRWSFVLGLSNQQPTSAELY